MNFRAPTARAPDTLSLHTEAVRAITRGDDARALALFREAARIEPRNPMHTLRAADCLVRLGRTEDALATYRQVADRYVADGHTARAASVFALILRLAPRDLAAADRLANLRRVRAAQVAAPAASTSTASDVVPPEVAELFPVLELEHTPAPRPADPAAPATASPPDEVALLEATVRALLAELLRTQNELALSRARAEANLPVDDGCDQAGWSIY